MEAHERVLDDLLPCSSLVEKEAGQAHQREVVLAEEVREQGVAVDGRRSCHTLGGDVAIITRPDARRRADVDRPVEKGCSAERRSATL